MIEADRLKQILEAALLAADEPLTLDQFLKLFREGEIDSESIRAEVREALKALQEEASGRGYELVRVASGFRYQVRQELSPWISRLWEEKPPRYSRALLETLALIAYRQPVTRGDIEDVRGVSVSQSIMRTLVERGWIRVVGQREVPGRPAMYGTTRAFLDYFNLKSLDQLPPLPEIQQLIEPVIVAESEALDGVPPEPMTQWAETEPSSEEATSEDRSASDEEPSEMAAGDAESGAAEGARAAETPGSAEPADESERSAGVQTAEVVKLPTAQH